MRTFTKLVASVFARFDRTNHVQVNEAPADDVPANDVTVEPCIPASTTKPELCQSSIDFRPWDKVCMPQHGGFNIRTR